MVGWLEVSLYNQISSTISCILYSNYIIEDDLFLLFNIFFVPIYLEKNFLFPNFLKAIPSYFRKTHFIFILWNVISGTQGNSDDGHLKHK